MKQIILLLCTALFVVSCKEKINSVQDVMNAMSPDKQKFTIDPATDNIIKGEKGTQIFIPANALKFKDGTTPSGRVKVELKEFFSLSDFISNDLSTRSDSFLLETNGMLYISATADGKELVVDNNKSYAIAFPKSDSTKNMELFYGDSAGTGNVNWQSALPMTEGFSFGYDSLLVDSTLYKKEFSVCSYVYSINNDPVLWRINHSDSTIFEYFRKNFKPTDTAFLNALCERGEVPGMHFEIDKNGKITTIDFDSYTEYFKGTPVPLRKQLADFLLAMPGFKMESMPNMHGEYFHIGLCCHTKFDQDKYKERFDQKYSQYRNKAIEKMDKGDLGIYIFQATRFGWINCDRFYYDENIEKINYIVKAGDTKNTKVMIVFDSIRSIMNGLPGDNGFVFENVPQSSKIKVIAISYRDGKPLLSKMTTTVSKQSFTLSGFKEFTLKELERELNN